MTMQSYGTVPSRNTSVSASPPRRKGLIEKEMMMQPKEMPAKEMPPKPMTRDMKPIHKKISKVVKKKGM